MNRPLSVYLCGPINGCTDEEANDWRRLVADLLAKAASGTEFEIIDPMRRDYRGREAECVREIVELDKVDVARADVLIASAPKPSVGTSMEVFLAFQTGKLVITVTPPNGPPPSPWLVYHSNALVHSYEAAVDVVAEYARGLA